MENLFWIIAAIVVVGLIIYFLKQKKGPAKPVEKGPEVLPSPPEGPAM